MKFKIAVLSLLALGATALTGFSQAIIPFGQYTAQTIALPVTSLAVSGTTNLAAGWSGVVTVTNTSTTWNSSSNAFVSVTNVVSATNTSWSVFNATAQKDVGVQVSWQSSTNISLVFANSTVYGQPATMGRTTWAILDATTAQTNAAGYRIVCTNFPAAFGGGLGYYYVVTVNNLDSVNVLTNLSINPAREVNSP